MSSNQPSRDFFDLIKAIGEAKSKQEEDRIILTEMKILKSKMFRSETNKKQMQEYVVRMMYCELLGHEASFGYIHAVNMCHSENVLSKRIGYLASSVLLNADHELIILIVNTLQRDLKSTNQMKIISALTACCRLINAETMPAVYDMVVALLDHPRELVRKKAVMALHKFIQIDKDRLQDLTDRFRRILCDKDPSVMASSLSVFLIMAENEKMAREMKDLVPSFVSILKQIIERRLPRGYDYHRVPTPWVQIKLLQILALLGSDDQTTSEGMYGVVEQTLKAAEIGINIGHAIVYECVRTIATIYPNSSLIETAGNAITTFISSENHNLKYLGITGLAQLVKVGPKYAARHQMAVIDCLEDSDESLKRKTLDLLYKMTNGQNVTVIADKLLSYLQNTADMYLREELVSRVTLLAERFAPDNEWFMSTMNKVFELGGKLVRPETAHNLIRLIAEGTGEDEDADMELRRLAVLAYLELLGNRNLPDILLQIIAWVVGEYGYLVEESGEYNAEDIEMKICEMIERGGISSETRTWGVSALTKLTAAHGVSFDRTKKTIDKYCSSASTELQQRCYEYKALVENMTSMVAALPLDASYEDIDVDPDLSFLDSYVQQALANGASQYLTAEDREDLEMDVVNPKEVNLPQLKMTSYPKPEERPTPAASTPASSTGATSSTVTSSVPVSTQGLSTLTHGVKKRWGRQTVTTVPEPIPVTDDMSAQKVEKPTVTSSYVSTEEEVIESDEPEETPQFEPQPMSEKEKLANALFGIIGERGPAHPHRGAGRRARGNVRPKVQSRATSKPGSEPSVQIAPKKSNDLDLLGDFMGGGDAAPVQATSKAKIADDLMELADAFGGMSSGPAGAAPSDNKIAAVLASYSQPAGQSKPVHKPMAVADTDILTPFSSRSGADLMSSVPALSAPITIGQDITAVQLTPRLGAFIGDSPRQPSSMNQRIAQDRTLQLAQFKAFCPNELIVALMLCNTSRTSLTSVTLDVTVPQGLSATLVRDPEPESVTGTLCKWVHLPPMTAVMLVSRIGSVPQLGAAMKVSIRYSDDLSERSLSANIPLVVSDMLRPANDVTVQAFSVNWSKQKFERRVKVNSSVAGTAEYSLRIQNQCNLFSISAIGSEVIAAGKLAGTELNCLVHGVVTPSGDGRSTVIITVKANDKKFSEVLTQYLQRVFM